MCIREKAVLFPCLKSDVHGIYNLEIISQNIKEIQEKFMTIFVGLACILKFLKIYQKQVHNFER